MPEKSRLWPLWLIVDLLLIILFALLGRREHEHGLALGGILFTALPFMLGYLISVLSTKPWASIHKFWPAGIVTWLGTVLLGVLLRLAFGSTAAWSFIMVATIVLGAFLLLRRLVTGVASKRLGKQQA